MALFQKSVLNKYLKGLDETLINTQYEAFKNYFLNPEIQDNIRESKEEQFQATFLNELFVKILGYTLNPNPNYNLTTEYKNVKDAKKADGAILQDGKAIGVIELKGMNTTNLDKIESQAFGYKNNQPDAIYVVTSNFEKIRFYIDNAVDFEEFNLFHLSLERFKILYLCLAKDNVFINLPKQIKDSSLEEEQNVTKKLYKDYSTFKQQLFQSIVKLNPNYDKLILFKKTQKLLDRFLFIFFAEDGGLLPPNSIRAIIEQWVQLRDELDAYTPLYSRYKKYFGYMNTGHKGKKHDIFAYNGGLFAPDDILDNIKIDDTILYTSTQKLSGYDFKSEVDVNILGHIFEHSLNEIENVTAELAGQTVDKSKTKRKKDGVFYTPKYITKYIVENTVGKLCEEQKTALGIDETEYNKSRKGRKKATLKLLKQQLDDYRSWLLEITICDPACGSGAFLNQALEFLIEEHTYIDELETKLLGGSFVFPNVENAILENNLYGVDINEESVDIAKLSLWLRSAKPNRKLNSLNSNIKCGNSLIDDVNVAGDKAFNWEKEFPNVFDNGGFDVMIGNPPYVVNKNNNEFFEENFNTFKSKDLYAFFYEKGIDLLSNDGKLGYITPSSFMTNIGFLSLRNFLIKYNIDSILDLGENIFSDASVDSAILVITKEENFDNSIKVSNNLHQYKTIEKTIFKKLKDSVFNIYINPLSLTLCDKIDSGNVKFDKYVKFARGVEFGFRSEKITEEKLDDNYFSIVCGGDISRYSINFQDKFLLFDYKNPSIYKNPIIYTQEKILIRRIGNSIISCYDETGLCNVCDVYNLQIKEDNTYTLKHIQAIINSRFMNFYYDTKFKSVKKLFPKIPIQNLKLLPIPKFNNIKESSNGIVDKILTQNKLLIKKQNRFLKRLTDNLNIEKPSKKLQSFYDYNFKTFIKELKKKKVKLSLTEQDEWEDYFNVYTSEIKALQTEINRIDKEIDKMVYELYGLTEDEIEIVENS